MRRLFLGTAATVLALVGVGGYYWPPLLWSLLVVVPLTVLGLLDMTQKKQAVRRKWEHASADHF